MLEHKKSNPLIALLGAAALLMSAPAMAATAAAPTSATASVAAPTEMAAPAADEASTEDSASKAALPHAANVDFVSMFMGATIVVKLVMALLAICSVISWVLLIMKLMDFSSLNRVTTNFLEAYRGARSIADINRIAVSDEFAGNPLADMAAVATEEIQLSKQAGLSISG